MHNLNIKPTDKLIDSQGRKIRKLRVSLLDACNFRCFYCMPEDANFMKSSQWLTAEEIKSLCGILTNYGIEQIRITGGEPTLRKDFRKIVEYLSELPLKKLALTTNGYKLNKELEFLSDTTCRNINVSLDSLTEKKFEKITRSNHFNSVIEGIDKAIDKGFSIKVNTVIMKGINDNELSKFVEFSKERGIEVRFLELMKIGQACGVQDNLFVSADEMLKEIRKNENLTAVNVERDATAFSFLTESGAKIGFIASETKPFCGNCSRWRLSADGFLRACLMSSSGINIKNMKTEDLEDQLQQLLLMKPFTRIDSIQQDMNQIGG